ncbi:MAG: 6-bladed beta-propeller [Chlorobi bacterium]|nr:6-bladed beta-propeller [Chlorobiota bacterium]
MKYKIAVFILGAILICKPAGAQDKEETHFSVEWIDNFSSEKDIETEKGVVSQFLSLVTGDTEEKLLKPFNLVKYADDSYFILDQGRFLPLIVSPEGFEVVKNDDYKTFPSLVGVCNFLDGKILFTDSKLSKIFIYDFNEDELKQFSTSLDLEQPTGIAFDISRKKIYVAETAKHRITVFNEKGKLLKYIGKRGTGKGEFNFPTFVTVDKQGNLYTVDALNFRVQIFDKEGAFVSSFGEAGDATGYFNRPKGITVDSFGHIYLVDALFHTVQIFNPDGSFLYNFGGMGQVNSRFWLPVGIFIDDDNNIFIADSYNARIQIFRLVDGKK